MPEENRTAYLRVEDKKPNPLGNELGKAKIADGLTTIEEVERI